MILCKKGENMKRLFTVLAVALFCSACATATVEKLNVQNGVPLNAGETQKIYISLPKDGIYQNIKYEYSGQQVQHSFFEAFSRHSDDVILGEKVQNLTEAKKTAADIHAQILVYPVITHWEDRNTPWSGLRDKVRINVQVYDIGTGAMIDKTSLYATNRWLALVNAAPSNLLKKIIWPYVERLYR